MDLYSRKISESDSLRSNCLRRISNSICSLRASRGSSNSPGESEGFPCPLPLVLGLPFPFLTSGTTSDSPSDDMAEAGALAVPAEDVEEDGETLGVPARIHLVPAAGD